MTSWLLQIDPPSVMTNRTMLDLNGGPISLGSSDGSPAIDFGSASITAYETQQGQFGNTPVEYIYPNRTITINLLLGGTGYEEEEETARSQLQQKVARLQSEGGVLLRQRADGPAMYADIVNATLTIPDQWGETGDVEPGVQLVLETLPDFYGDEIQLDTIYATGVASAVLTASGATAKIEGDYPARCRLVVDDMSSNDQHGMLWALQSRNASTSPSAALAIPAKLMTPLNGAALLGSAPPAINTQVMSYTTTGNNVWTPFMVTTLAAGSVPLTHQGTFRVWARVEAGTGALRLVWGAGSLSVPLTNNPATPVGYALWSLVDLGTIRIQPTPDGSATEWFGVVQYLDDGLPGQGIYTDELYFQPVDESAGRLESSAVPNPTVIETSSWSGSSSNVALSGGGTVPWGNPTSTVGPPDFRIGAQLNFEGGGGEVTEYLTGAGYGFAIPSSATILGVQLAVYLNYDGTGAAGVPSWGSAKLAKAGAIVGASAPSPASFVVAGYGFDVLFTYGGPTDLWGTTLTPADVNNAAFGGGWMMNWPGGTFGGGAVLVVVDAIGINVWYQLATGLVVAQDAVAYAGQTMQIATSGITRENNTGTVNGPVSIQLGDLPRIPPSGLEDRPATLFVRPSRSDMNTLPDQGPDAFTVTPFYRPTYLSRA